MQYIERKMNEPGFNVDSDIRVLEFDNHYDIDLGEVLQKLTKMHLIHKDVDEHDKTRITVFSDNENDRNSLAGFMLSEIKEVTRNEQEIKAAVKFIKGLRNGKLLEEETRKFIGEERFLKRLSYDTKRQKQLWSYRKKRHAMKRSFSSSNDSGWDDFFEPAPKRSMLNPTKQDGLMLGERRVLKMLQVPRRLGKMLLDDPDNALPEFNKYAEQLEREGETPSALDLAGWLHEKANVQIIEKIYNRLGSNFALAAYLMTVHTEYVGGIRMNLDLSAEQLKIRKEMIDEEHKAFSAAYKKELRNGRTPEDIGDMLLMIDPR